eukprot:CAMPEP_0119067080 /NCGR_PEP_ID=MMETSP1178-20130426/9435_1 /TAXON_ID=33656 /ORGANISM="unid sp, Strain CCMP2000" /LENGTH=66 /DNA_ID=CAMNT_0007048715 /DNA_START=74 /DNA_END=274 /DNA_ORIENTATION=+
MTPAPMQILAQVLPLGRNYIFAKQPAAPHWAPAVSKRNYYEYRMDGKKRWRWANVSVASALPKLGL